MKKTIALLVMVLHVGPTRAAPNTADMPYLYPDKCALQKSIVIPKGVEGTTYFFNRDCTVAYIVPPPTGTVEISKPAVLENMRLCPAVAQSLSSVAKISKQIDGLLDLSAAVPVDDPRQEKYAAAREKLLRSALELKAAFVGVPGMTVQMNFRGSLTPEYMEAVTAANLPFIEQGLVKIRRAPLQKSYLTFNMIVPGTTRTYAENPVLESNVLGILSRADESQQDRTSVRFDGATQGYVTLSLIGACPLMEGDFNHLSQLKLDKEAASKYLAATNTMMVPAISSYGYSAVMDVKSATDVLYNDFKQQGKFTSKEIKNLVLTGSISNTITVNSWTYEDLNGQQLTQYDSMISVDNQNKIKSALMARYLDQLVQFNMLREITPLETPQAGNVTNTGYRTECWSSSSWFGLSRDSGCREVAYQFLTAVDGRSDQKAEIINRLGTKFEDRMEILHPVARVFTSTFEVKEGAK